MLLKLLRRVIIHKFWVAYYCFQVGLYWQGCLETVFKDGKLLKDYTLTEIRERINESL